MSSLWPEEIEKRTSFYYKSSSSTKQKNDTKYHLTVLNTVRDNVKHKLILYHSETKEVVDVMNAEDIIGVELEIALFDDDNVEKKVSTISNSSQSTCIGVGVGINHPHAKERAEQMAKFEQNLGKKLIGGDIDDFENIVNEDDEYESKDNDRQCSEGNTTTSSSAAYLNIYCYPRSVQKSGLSALLQNCYKVDNASQYVKLEDILSETDDDECDQSQLGHRYEKHRRFKLFPTEDFADVQTLITAIRRVANLGHFEDTQCSTSSKTSEMKQHPLSASKRKKKYFVVVNPFSGTKKAKHIYETMMIKMLRECGVDHDVLFTQYSGHAYERMKKVECDDETDISKYDAIISMGGDGLLSEIINGLKSRDDFENIAKELKFGIIGCGTCNGLAASLLYASNVSISLLFIFGVLS